MLHCRYNFWSLTDNVVFHHYGRHSSPRYFENASNYSSLVKPAEQRVKVRMRRASL